MAKVWEEKNLFEKFFKELQKGKEDIDVDLLIQYIKGFNDMDKRRFEVNYKKRYLAYYFNKSLLVKIYNMGFAKIIIELLSQNLIQINDLMVFWHYTYIPEIWEELIKSEIIDPTKSVYLNDNSLIEVLINDGKVDEINSIMNIITENNIQVQDIDQITNYLIQFGNKE